MFEPLPALIRMERERQGLTQEVLAKLANISRSRLAAVEKGDDNVSLKTLLKVANTLKMSHLQIGGLHIEAAPPDAAVLLAAADALETARKALDYTSEMRADLDRAYASVSSQLARVTRSAQPDRGKRAGKPDASAIAEALRQLAEPPGAPEADSDERETGTG